jgi:CRP-like cAMP-binding protein
MDLIESMNQVYPLKLDTISEIMKFTEVRTVSKGEYAIEQDKVSRHLIFIRKGIMRMGFLHDGREDTMMFGLDGDPFTSIESMMHGEPSKFFVEAITECEAYFIDLHKIMEMVERRPEMQRWLMQAALMELYYLGKKRRYFSDISSYDRWVMFIGQRPDLVDKVPTKYLAQYLGVSRETLSRVKSKYLREQCQKHKRV